MPLFVHEDHSEMFLFICWIVEIGKIPLIVWRRRTNIAKTPWTRGSCAWRIVSLRLADCIPVPGGSYFCAWRFVLLCLADRIVVPGGLYTCAWRIAFLCLADC
ncbi:hypothetical protein JTB14_006023 [Gonioctena quinquepunctata]|nr:hypothetical protein JTB14_006023 [Gonioctena quinquepunctata]